MLPRSGLSWLVHISNTGLGLSLASSTQRPPTKEAPGLHCAMAAYEAAMARRQLAPFSAVCFVGIDDTTFSPLRPSGRCIFSPPRSYEGQDASIPGLGGRDHHIRLDNASGELLCSVGSVKNGQLTRP